MTVKCCGLLSPFTDVLTGLTAVLFNCQPCCGLLASLLPAVFPLLGEGLPEPVRHPAAVELLAPLLILEELVQQGQVRPLSLLLRR